ncbi:DUF2508 family protein [Bengtsoniella intestinalis]|uniref:DUF2508 family protein n=1 Tax=Bengtsoniella intestinalis TaxID=3073143 RepID=UPI00391F4B14
MKTLAFQNKNKPDGTLLQLQKELAIAREDLRQAYLRFDQVVDTDLIEACIYQMNAAMAQCNYLVRTIKAHTGGAEMDLPAAAVAASQMEEQATWT